MGREKYLSGLKYFRKASEIEMTKNTLSITARQVSKRLNIDSISLERRIGMAIVLAIKPIRAEKLGKILSNTSHICLESNLVNFDIPKTLKTVLDSPK